MLAQYFQNNPQGSIKVIIKAHNYYPYSKTIPINFGTGTDRVNPDRQAFGASVRRFGNEFVMSYLLPFSGPVSVNIYNVKGVCVEAVSSAVQSAGSHTTI